MKDRYRNIDPHSFSDDPFFTPSNRVWSNVENEMWPKKSRKVIWVIFLSFLAVLPTLLFFIGYSIDDSSTKTVSGNAPLPQSLTNNPQLASQPNTELSLENKVHNTINPPIHIEKVSEIIESGIATLSVIDKGKQTSSSNYLDQPLNIKMSEPIDTLQNANFTRVEYPLMSLTEGHEFSSKDLHKPSDNTPNNISTDQGKMSIIPTISQLETSIHASKIDLAMPRIKLKESTRDQRFWAIYSGLHSNIHEPKLSNKFNEIIEKSTFDEHFNYGLQFGKNYGGRWQWSTGLHYQKSKISTSYDLNIAYDLNNEVAGEVEHTNTFNHSLPTVGGPVETSLTLRRSVVSNVQHNENVNLDLSTTIVDHTIAIPLFFRWYTKEGYTGFFVESQNQLGRIVNRKVGNVVLASHHSEVHIKEGHVSLSNSFDNKYFITSGLHAGYTWSHDSHPIRIDLIAGIDQKVIGNLADRYIVGGLRVAMTR